MVVNECLLTLTKLCDTIYLPNQSTEKKGKTGMKALVVLFGIAMISQSAMAGGISTRATVTDMGDLSEKPCRSRAKVTYRDVTYITYERERRSWFDWGAAGEFCSRLLVSGVEAYAASQNSRYYRSSRSYDRRRCNVRYERPRRPCPPGYRPRYY